MSWNRLEHQVWNQIKLYDLQNARFILAVSGGLDSMVLLQIMQRLNLKNELIVAHFHHGPSSDAAQAIFRDYAMTTVKNACENHQIQKLKVSYRIKYVFDKAKKNLKSEADYRQARREFIKSVVKKYPKGIVVTAHHQNDQLETVLLKMMRSSGVEGLKNFKEFNGKIFRPFMQNQKSELRTYALTRKVRWADDPSNQDTQFLRNWLRQDLFPQLEFRHSGALRNLFTSMDRLLKETSRVGGADQFFRSAHRRGSGKLIFKKTKKSCVIEIDRTWYKNLDRFHKEEVLFLALKQAQSYYFQLKHEDLLSKIEKKSSFWDITKGRVKEISKRLDKNQKELKFIIGPLKALTSSKKIMLQFKM